MSRYDIIIESSNMYAIHVEGLISTLIGRDKLGGYRLQNQEEKLNRQIDLDNRVLQFDQFNVVK